MITNVVHNKATNIVNTGNWIQYLQCRGDAS